MLNITAINNNTMSSLEKKAQSKSLLLTVIARHLIGCVHFENDDWLYAIAQKAARMTLDNDWTIQRAQQYYDDTIAIESVDDNQ